MPRHASVVDADALNRRIQATSDEIDRETDRAAVILATAEIDEALHDLLKAFFLPPSAASKKYGFTLFGLDEAAGTLSARIELAYRSGLIPDWCQYEAHVIRKIRNEFAHRTTGYSFTQSPARDLLGLLRFPTLARNSATKNAFPRAFWKKPKNLFAMSAMAVVVEIGCGYANLLNHRSRRIKPIKGRSVRFPASGSVLS